VLASINPISASRVCFNFENQDSKNLFFKTLF